MLRTQFEIGSIAKMHREEPTTIQGDGIQLEEEAILVTTFPDVIKTPFGNDEKIVSLTKLNSCPNCDGQSELLGLILETVNVAECHQCEQFIWYRSKKEWRYKTDDATRKY